MGGLGGGRALSGAVAGGGSSADHVLRAMHLLGKADFLSLCLERRTHGEQLTNQGSLSSRKNALSIVDVS